MAADYLENIGGRSYKSLERLTGLEDMKHVVGTTCIALFGFLILMLAFYASPWPSIVDEVLYIWSSFEISDGRSFVIRNGYKELELEALTFHFLKSGPHGLTSQYPVGMSIAGGAMFAIWGTKGLVILNALAAACTLPLTRILARTLFGDDRGSLLSVFLLLGCSFWLEFAFGIWPHSVCVFLIVSSFVAAFKSLDVVKFSRSSALRWAFVSGLLLSTAFLFRYDSILALPSLGIMVLLYSSYPIMHLIIGALGLAPAIALSSYVNSYKFGTLNPLSYGASSGGIDIRSYAVFGVILGGMALLIIATRIAPKAARFIWFVAFCVMLFATLTFSPVASIMSRYIGGLASLIVDTRLLPDGSPGLVRTGDDGLLIWGKSKRALGQSLPWIGILTILVLKPWPAGCRRAYLFLLMTIAVWTFPFIIRSWHGGYGSNMRYFLPLLPLLCILGARLLIDMGAATPIGRRAIFFGAVGGCALGIFWIADGIGGSVTGQLSLGVWTLCGVTASACLCAFPGGGKRWRHTVCLVATSIGFGVSALFGALDLRDSQMRREWVGRVNLQLAKRIPEPSVIIGYTPHLVFQIPREHGFVGDRIFDDLAKVLDAGYALWVSGDYVDVVKRKNPGLIEVERFAYEAGDMFRFEISDGLN